MGTRKRVVAARAGGNGLRAFRAAQAPWKLHSPRGASVATIAAPTRRDLPLTVYNRVCDQMLHTHVLCMLMLMYKHIIY